jgi:hypothetical protein
MRPRIVHVDQRIYNVKRTLALIIVQEDNCSLTRAFKRVEFNLAYKRINYV